MVKSPHDGKDVVVPCGELYDCTDNKSRSNYTLNYNEYIVYNVDQVKMRYILRVKFNFDDM